MSLYELASQHNRADLPNENPKAAATVNTGAPATPREPATARELDLLAELVDKAMAAANYSPRAMRNANLHDMHLMLRRLALTRHDAKRILGLFRRRSCGA